MLLQLRQDKLGIPPQPKQGESVWHWDSTWWPDLCQPYLGRHPIQAHVVSKSWLSIEIPLHVVWTNHAGLGAGSMLDGKETLSKNGAGHSSCLCQRYRTEPPLKAQKRCCAVLSDTGQTCPKISVSGELNQLSSQHLCPAVVWDVPVRANCRKAAGLSPSHCFCPKKHTPSSTSPSCCLTRVCHQLEVSLSSRPCRVGISCLSLKMINRIPCSTHWVWLLAINISALASTWKPGVHISVEIYMQENNAVV